MSFWPNLLDSLRNNRFNNPHRAPTTLILGSGASLYPGGASPFSEIIEDIIGGQLPPAAVDPSAHEERMKEFDSLMAEMDKESVISSCNLTFFPP